MGRSGPGTGAARRGLRSGDAGKAAGGPPDLSSLHDRCHVCAYSGGDSKHRCLNTVTQNCCHRAQDFTSVQSTPAPRRCLVEAYVRTPRKGTCISTSETTSSVGDGVSVTEVSPVRRRENGFASYADRKPFGVVISRKRKQMSQRPQTTLRAKTQQKNASPQQVRHIRTKERWL